MGRGRTAARTKEEGRHICGAPGFRLQTCRLAWQSKPALRDDVRAKQDAAAAAEAQ